jgi:hypothetical protein
MSVGFLSSRKPRKTGARNFPSRGPLIRSLPGNSSAAYADLTVYLAASQLAPFGDPRGLVTSQFSLSHREDPYPLLILKRLVLVVSCHASIDSLASRELTAAHRGLDRLSRGISLAARFG